MRFINNIKLKNKLILMLIVPITGMVVFSISLYQSASSDADNATKMLLLTEVAIEVNRGIDSLQNEHGITAKFIKAYGKKFNKELAVSQQVTDESLVELNKTIEGINGIVFNDTFNNRLNQVKTNISELSGKRSAIKNKKLRRNKAEDFYKKLVEDMLFLIEMMPRLAADKDLANITNAYVNFMRLKNLAGQERLILLNVFKRDQFLGKEFNNFNQSVNFQTVYESSFLSLATETEKEYFKQTLSDGIVIKAKEMREKAFLAADYGAFNIEPETWSETQGAKLQLLNKVAERLTQDVKDKVEMTRETSSNLQMMITLFSIFAYVLTLFFWWIISRGIGSSVTSILHIMDRIAIGDLNNKISKNSKDEFGHLLGSIGKMQQDLKKKIDKEAIVSAANARVKQALDNVSANVMVADQNNDIIYINQAALTLFSYIENDLAKSIGGFKASEIVGSNIDKFHKNPVHQQGLVKGLSARHEAKFLAGSRTMSFIANPVLGENGDRLGTVVEWQDQTDEIKTEKEIQSIVHAVKEGDLNQRIMTDGKTGFMLNLSEGINEMVEEVSDTLNDIDNSMSALSQGDLTQNIERSYLGTFGSVASNVNETIHKLGQIVGEISHASVEVSTTAKEILDGNNSLSSRTEHQASALEQTASSMEEITSTVKQNSDNAQLGNELSSDARDMADKGGKVVDDAIVAMQEINNSSKKIAEIIGVIDEIAFQTNLLALNASVEAAPAGEQGRGFAVVATEVRNLAGRSATAAKEIKELIQDSVHKVNAGSELVNKSGETLKDIVMGVKKVGDIVGEIASASQEQSTGIEQVNAAVTSMDETTQQNAALAEQTSAASVSLSKRTNDMARHLEFFTQDSNVDYEPVPRSYDNEKLKSNAPVELPVNKSVNYTRSKNVQPVTKNSKKNTVTEDFNDDEWEEF